MDDLIHVFLLDDEWWQETENCLVGAVDENTDLTTDIGREFYQT